MKKLSREDIRKKIIETLKKRTLDDIPDITASHTGGPRPKNHPFYDYNPKDFPEKYDPEEVERFPATAASNDELLHADIVSSVVDTVADTALLNMGKDREDIVLTGIDNEMEGREMDQEEVDFSQINLQQVFRDVMIDLAAMEKQRLGETRQGDHKKDIDSMIKKARVDIMEEDERELQTEAVSRWQVLSGIKKPSLLSETSIRPDIANWVVLDICAGLKGVNHKELFPDANWLAQTGPDRIEYNTIGPDDPHGWPGMEKRSEDFEYFHGPDEDFRPTKEFVNTKHHDVMALSLGSNTAPGTGKYNINNIQVQTPGGGRAVLVFNDLYVPTKEELDSHETRPHGGFVDLRRDLVDSGNLKALCGFSAMVEELRFSDFESGSPKLSLKLYDGLEFGNQNKGGQIEISVDVRDWIPTLGKKWLAEDLNAESTVLIRLSRVTNSMADRKAQEEEDFQLKVCMTQWSLDGGGEFGRELPEEIIKYNASGDHVTKIQEALEELSDYYPGEVKSPGAIDSQYGQKTYESIKSVQAKAKISVDGIYGSDTKKAILKLGMPGCLAKAVPNSKTSL